jgi:ABC-type nitrate/sulfonate/bicarbonate transport system substrate-binding protein
VKPLLNLLVIVASVSASATASIGCATPPPDTAARVIRVGYSGEPDFGDLPSLIAHTRLRDTGYQIEPTFFSASDVAVQALSEGSVDIIHGSMISAWTAIGRGALIRTVMDHVANPYRLVVAPGISTCHELTGRRLGLPAESAVSTHLVRAYLSEECPEAKPEVLLLTESSSRAAAFLKGGVDAGALELSSLLWLQKQEPGRFTVLSDFSARWPAIKTTGVHVSAGFARQHGDMVRDYLRAQLAANRDVVADPLLLVEAANDNMGRSEDWESAAHAYVDARVWPENGGLTGADVDNTLTFFKTYSRLDSRLTRESVADLTFLEEVMGGR